MTSPIGRLISLEPTHSPNQAISETLHSKYLIAFIGAFAVGKTTLIRAIDKRNDTYSEVVSFTTRPPRGQGDAYRFIDHNDVNLANLATKADRGELVNLSVHPTTDYVYGTEAGDYRTGRCMLATTSKSFESDKHLPFARVIPIVVVADELSWLPRIRERSASEQELSARLAEARQSLVWSLGQEDVYFADNSAADVDRTSDRIVADIESGGSSDQASRNLAYRMLQVATN